MENTVTTGGGGAGGGLDFVSLFLHADPVVKVIMAGLLLASLVCWAIILEKSFLLWRQARNDAHTLAGYRSNALLQGRKGAYAVAQTLETEAPIHEHWSETLRERFLARARLLLAQLKRDREAGLAFLATVASAAPFIGLFGTVWGIMNSFAAIAQSKNTSLDVVAPGIAEALLATAIGLFAAIPAAVFYNRLSMQVARSLVPAEELVQEMLILRAKDGRA